jgi:hypothetical protein
MSLQCSHLGNRFLFQQRATVAFTERHWHHRPCALCRCQCKRGARHRYKRVSQDSLHVKKSVMFVKVFETCDNVKDVEM